MKDALKLFAIGTLGVVLSALGGFFVFSNYVDSSWPRVEGMVIGSRTVADTASPIVEYQVDSTTFQVISSDNPLFSTFENGQKLQVAYNPNSAGEAKIVESGLLAVVSWVLIVLGLLLLGVATIVNKRQKSDWDDDGTERETQDDEHAPVSYQV